MVCIQSESSHRIHLLSVLHISITFACLYVTYSKNVLQREDSVTVCLRTCSSALSAAAHVVFLCVCEQHTKEACLKILFQTTGRRERRPTMDRNIVRERKESPDAESREAPLK